MLDSRNVFLFQRRLRVLDVARGQVQTALGVVAQARAEDLGRARVLAEPRAATG
jgi:hypothetical protein